MTAGDSGRDDMTSTERVGAAITGACTRRPRLVTGIMVALTVVLGLLAGVPSLFPESAPMLNSLRVDTDPENMLASDEPVRVYHNEAKRRFGLSDIIVLGVVNESHPDGVYNPETLAEVYELTQYAKTLHGAAIGEDDDPEAGVVRIDLIAPSTVDFIESAGVGTVRFDWLMPSPPASREDALAVRDRARRIPFLNGTMIADETDKALCLYVPLTDKHLAHQVSAKLQSKIDEFGSAGANQYYITGLPVAEDTFGVEMFKQMAISAPLAMLVIFLLMWVFFKKITLIIPPLIVAMVTSIMTMALLIISGKTVHIMSSMIPIFIMPIAVLDAIHIISDFFDRYGQTRDRRATLITVMKELFSPMLYTSLTTTAGFASLALTPIPPVQVFGIFVAIGVMLAWVLTITFIPAAIMFIPESRLADIAGDHGHHESETSSPMARMLASVGRFTYDKAGVIVAIAVVAVGVSAYGISRIRINDNPTKWFEPGHPIRIADRVLNKHFGGTYMAYLELSAPEIEGNVGVYAHGLVDRLGVSLDAESAGIGSVLTTEVLELSKSRSTPWDLLAGAQAFVQNKLDTCPDEEFDAWDSASDALGVERARFETFKQPEVLRWMRSMQDHLETVLADGDRQIVGKSNSISDIVMTVHRDLLGGEQDQYRIPDTSAAVAQCLIQYQSSHRYTDLDHFVMRDSSDPASHFRRSSLWVQLTSGDNRDMETVTKALDAYIEQNPLPGGIEHSWFGLTYINVIWQDKMVSGMLQAFLGSFLVVLFMMIILFRSALWGILSMIPLTLTVAMIYGLIGLIGKDYDMPVAVLSSLSLGLSVDYAIHFLARGRNMYRLHGSWKQSVGPMFGEPARAITRNAIVVGFGFLPLLAAPLVPYQTVGFFIAAILLTAGISTLLLLPALIRFLEPWLFADSGPKAMTCRCGTCIVTSLVLVALVVINVNQFVKGHSTTMSSVTLALIPVLAIGCFVVSRRRACGAQKSETNNGGTP